MFIAESTGNELLSWEVPCSMSPSVAEVTSTSNTGIPGRWIFRLSGRINSACPDGKSLRQNINALLNLS